MNNALGQPQTVVLLGGTSDIGLAIVRALRGPALRRVVLCCRSAELGEAAAAELRSAEVSVDVVTFDLGDTAGHAGVLEQLHEVGDIDVVVLAAAVLGDGSAMADPGKAAEVASVNFTGSLSIMVGVGNLLRAQGHGALVVLSSVAGERVRKANAVYGATKAGIDGFAQGYGDALAADGVHVMVVRPGFVHSKMTAGLAAAPFATTPEVVAQVTLKGLRSRRRMVWAPPVLRPVFAVLRHLPGPVWRRLPLG
jgi:decaprenylphospho-beta-D-erythro-pentofuranosid-2-ulose 2-reductase